MNASQAAKEKVAQIWCLPTTKHLPMIPELAEAFAEALQEVWDTGVYFATSEQLLNELKARLASGRLVPPPSAVEQDYLVYRVEGLGLKESPLEQGEVFGIVHGTEEQVRSYCDVKVMELSAGLPVGVSSPMVGYKLVTRLN